MSEMGREHSVAPGKCLEAVKVKATYTGPNEQVASDPRILSVAGLFVLGRGFQRQTSDIRSAVPPGVAAATPPLSLREA